MLLHFYPPPSPPRPPNELFGNLEEAANFARQASPASVDAAPSLPDPPFPPRGRLVPAQIPYVLIHPLGQAPVTLCNVAVPRLTLDLAVPRVQQENGAEIVLVADAPPQRLAHCAVRLLGVPLVPGEQIIPLANLSLLVVVEPLCVDRNVSEATPSEARRNLKEAAGGRRASQKLRIMLV